MGIVSRAAALVLALAIVALGAVAGSAATLTVNSLGDDTTAIDGLVTLREALLAAEADGTTDLGESGSGADVVVFDPALVAAGDAEIELATVGDTQFGPSAFLVTTDITIQGPSGGRGITLRRNAGVTRLRHFSIAASGRLALENLTLADGVALGGSGGTNDGDDGGGGGGGAGLGGAIYNQGTLSVTSSTLAGNLAQGGSGGAGADNVGGDSGGGGGGGGLGGNGGSVPAGGPDGGGGGGGTFGNGGGPVGGGGGGGGGGTQTDGSNGSGAAGGAGGSLNGGAGGNANASDGGNATGPGGGGGGGGDERIGGSGDFGGGGGGSGENDSGVDHPAGSGGFGGGGGGGGEDDSGGRGGFGGGGGGGSEDGAGGPAISESGGFGAGSGGNFGGALVGSAGGGGGAGLGGAIFNHNGTVLLVNATVSGNLTQGGTANGGGAYTGADGRAFGGGVFNLNGSLTVEASTFAENTAGGGSDVYNLAHETTAGVTPADATTLLSNTILGSFGVENVRNDQTGADPGVATVRVNPTDILAVGVLNSGGVVDDTGSVVTDPLLGSLKDNGGPTRTHAPLFPSSPAVDASAAGPPADQRGATRPQGGSFDIGAVEVAQAAPGVLAPGDLLMSEFDRGSAVDIRGGGDFALAPRFAYGLAGPMGLCSGPGGEVYAAEFNSGEVTVITTGGDFTSATPFASGLSFPAALLCTDTQILVGEYGSGEITDVTAGGDFTGAAAFASNVVSVLGLFRDANGTLWAASQAGRVHDVTAGGDFAADPGFASMGGDLRGVAQRGTALLVAEEGSNEILDFSAGGDLTPAPVFATVRQPTQLVDLGPVGLFALSNLENGVFEVSAGGDFSAAAPFATGVENNGGFADLELVLGCGDAILDPAIEECDDGNTLDGDGCSAACQIRCAPAPAPGCVAAASASVKLDERKAGKEKLKASLKKLGADTTQADFGDPVAGDTRVALCLYDGADALELDLRVDRAGALCGSKPCWKALSTKGFGYKDPVSGAEGVQKITEKSGPSGKGSVALQGRNNVPKGQTSLPTGAAAALQGETSATLQLLTSDGLCFEAGLTTVQTADGQQFKARTP
jgi:cysteine-rich repeat protein